MSNITAIWSHLASSERLQRSSQSLAVLDSRALIFGGEVLSRQPIDNQFDIVQVDENGKNSADIRTLAAPADAPAPRVGHTAVTLKDSIYLFSGRGGLAMAPLEENGALWRYSPESSSWTCIKPANPAAAFPAGRSYHAMASNGINKIYVHAGCPENGRQSDLWCFNIDSKLWTELPAAPPPSRGGTSIAYNAGRLYRMNGFDGSCEQGGSIDVYNTKDCTWRTITYQADGTSGPEARSVGALLAVKVGDRDALLAIFGERDPSSLGHAGAGKMLGDVWLFDLEHRAWTKVEANGPAPLPRGWFGADMIRSQAGNDAVLIHGGLAEDNSRLGDVWKLSFKS